MKPKELLALAEAMRKGGVSRLVLPHQHGAYVIERHADPPSSATGLQNPRQRPTEGLRAEQAVPKELAAAGVDPATFSALQQRAADLVD